MAALTALIVFYFLAAISIWLGLISLRGGIRFVRYLHAELDPDYPDFTPFVSVFVPCRGVDEGLEENIAAILGQDYPFFEVVFVADRSGDPALQAIEDTRRSFNRNRLPPTRVVIAGPATDTGQKVHNLRAAVAAADSRSEVFAFVDTDAHPNPAWLHCLVRPLGDELMGATTGYRWFVPERGGFAAHLRSVWNAAIASALGANQTKNFCWGGSTAIRRGTFERLGVKDRWRGTASDDFTLTAVLHEAELPIKFVPQCLTPAYESCSLRNLLEFTTRQLKITRTYAPHLWRAVLVGSAIFVLVFFGGLSLVIARACQGQSVGGPLALLLLIFTLGAIKSSLRLRAVSLFVPGPRSPTAMLAHATLWPAASFLYLCNSLAAAGSRRINWRGITYELKSSKHTVILPPN